MKKFLLATVLLLVTGIFFVACEQEVKTAEDYYEQQEYSKAYKLFLSRAKAGEASAQNYLGMIYYLGLINKRDVKKASVWFEKAAKQKHSAAQLNYGMVIEQQATEADQYLESYKWYYAAHENGSKEAEKRITHLLEHHRIFHNQRAFAQKQMDPYIDFTNKEKHETIVY